MVFNCLNLQIGDQKINAITCKGFSQNSSAKANAEKNNLPHYESRGLLFPAAYQTTFGIYNSITQVFSAKFLKATRYFIDCFLNMPGIRNPMIFIKPLN